MMEKKIARLEQIIAIQCTDGTWDFNAYHFGLANGLLLALAILKDEKPKLLVAPDEWLEDKAGILSESMPVEYDTIDGKWWMFVEGAAVKPLTDDEAAEVI